MAGEERIFAVGDGAYLVNDANPQGLPMQAQVAIAQGREATENVARHLQGIPLKAFQTPAVSYIIPLGGRYAAAKLRERWILQGFVPWALKQLIELHYYCSLLGLVRGMRAWVGMEKICLQND